MFSTKPHPLVYRCMALAIAVSGFLVMTPATVYGYGGCGGGGYWTPSYGGYYYAPRVYSYGWAPWGAGYYYGGYGGGLHLDFGYHDYGHFDDYGHGWGYHGGYGHHGGHGGGHHH